MFCRRQRLIDKDPCNQTFEKLIAVWLPLRVDEDESRSITDVIVDLILEERNPTLTQNPQIKKEVGGFKILPNIVVAEKHLTGYLVRSLANLLKSAI